MEELFDSLTATGQLALILFGLLVAYLLLGSRSRRKRAARTVVVDGSNVLYWKDNAPDIGVVAELVTTLRKKRLIPLVIFDANVGYLVRDRYMDDEEMAAQIGLDPEQVLVVHKGEPADPQILKAAVMSGKRVVSNDRFRDWATDFPEIEQSGFLIRGRHRKGRVEVDLG